MKYLKLISCSVAVFITLYHLLSCVRSNNSLNSSEDKMEIEVPKVEIDQKTVIIDTLEFANSDYNVTFIELGSNVCYACQQMQIVMKSIEEKYGDKVRVVFYDVKTPEGRQYAEMYDIDIIPTQIFIDENGKEFYRHQDYFPEEEIVKILNTKGVK